VKEQRGARFLAESMQALDRRAAATPLLPATAPLFEFAAAQRVPPI
jgi:hypothetical protein